MMKTLGAKAEVTSTLFEKDNEQSRCLKLVKVIKPVSSIVRSCSNCCYCIVSAYMRKSK
jgi:hypothetical protein